jgi:hypothetical protein
LLPLVDLLPVQPPLAVHDVALVLFQVSVAACPAVTLVGDAEKVTVGVGEAGGVVGVDVAVLGGGDVFGVPDVLVPVPVEGLEVL